MRLAGRTAALRFAALALLVVVATVGCDSIATPTFDPAGPCVADGRVPGSYPDLEALVPRLVVDAGGGAPVEVAPTRVDSGRSCTPRALATYRSHGVSEVRYAGATWDWGDGNATVSAVFTTPDGQPPLDRSWVEEFYETTARASTKTDNVEVSALAIGPTDIAYRLDALNDLSLQTVVVWPAGDVIRVVIVATTVEPNASRQAHDERVDRAVERSVLENA